MKNLYTFLLLLFGSALQAQTVNFTQIDTLPQGAYGTAAWGDFDNDGFKDLVYISQVLPDAACIIYHNSGNIFTPVAQQFPLLYNPAACWGDLDKDGFEDLVVCGMDSVFNARTFVYRSLGNGTFQSMPNTIIGVSAGSVDLADYNNDGFPDIAIAGYPDSGPEQAAIYRNDSNFVFTDIHAAINGMHFGELKWADYDHDGRADLAVDGIRNNDTRLRLYHNMGADTFQIENYTLSGVAGSLDWIDYDRDGFPDLLLSGIDSTSTHSYTLLYRNEHNRMFRPVQHNIPDFGEPSAATVADFNNDSIPDVCLVGGSTFPNFSVIAFGNGDSVFTVEGFFNPDISNNFVAAADIDNDGDNDLVLSEHIYRNDGLNTFVKPVVGRESLFVFPSPASDFIHVSTTGTVCAFELSDLSGRCIEKSVVESSQFTVPVTGVEEGIYLLTVYTTSGKSLYKKLMIIND